jgi:transposase
MRARTIFNKLLSLQGAFVRNVTFLEKNEEHTILVGVARCARLHRCPLCAFRTAATYDQHPRTWRHLSLGKWRVLLSCTLHRIECPDHGVLNEAVPWAAPGSLFTLDFETLVAWLAREMNKTAVAALAKISWPTVGTIIRRFVERAIDKKRLDDLFVIGVDEVSYRKGHKYITVVANHATGAPVWMGEGRSQEALGGFFEELGKERTEKLATVTMDMAAPYIAEVRDRAPKARIAFDPFHVVKLASEAVQEVRRTEARERKGSAEADVLKDARWALLKAPENLLPEQKLKLAEVASLNSRVYRAYLLKEELRALYRCGPEAAKRHLAAFTAWASRSRLEPFVKLARTLRKHSEGILAAIELGVSNGRLEGINNKIGVIKHRAYGFHSAAALIAMIFLCCTAIEIDLPI